MAKTKGDFYHTPQQIRLFTLDKFLRRPRGATREQISEAVRSQNMGRRYIVYAAGKADNKYDRATFRRDLNALENMGANIREKWHFDPGAGGQACFYSYADPTWTMGNVKLKAEDLMAIFVARDLVSRYWGPPIAEELTRIIDHLGKEMPSVVSVQTDQMAPITFGPDGGAKNRASPKIWKNVLAATTKHLKLKLLYRAGWGPTPGEPPPPAERIMHPYNIVNLCGTWYLVGTHSETDLRVRQYHMDRILEATPLKPFKIPDEFKIDDLLDITFGRFIGTLDDVVDVRLRFRKQVTPLVKGREFQPYQKMKPLPDGGVELTLRVSQSGPWPLYHVACWVLSFGVDVEVMEPESLRELVHRAATATAAQYSKTTDGG